MRGKCGQCKTSLAAGEPAYCKDCFEKEIMIRNALLTYVSSYRGKSPVLILKNAALNYYSNEDVEAARQTMVDSVRHLIPEFPHLDKKRTDSQNRQARYIMMDDIIDMFKALDHVEQRSVPVFVCSDASQLPPGPENAGNMMAMFDALAAQQRQMQQMQETMTQVMQDVARNKSDIAQCHKARGVQNVKKRQQSVSRGGPTVPDQAAVPPNGTTDEAAVDGPTPGGSTDQTQERGYADAVLQPQTVNQGDEQFQTVGVNNGKRPNKGKGKNGGKVVASKPDTGSGRKKVVRSVGTAEDCGLLSAGPTNFQLQVTNVSPSVGTKDLVEYIENKAEGVKPTEIEDITSEGWNTKRFLLTFEYKHFDIIKAEGFWPKKIYFKRWFPQKQKDNITA